MDLSAKVLGATVVTYLHKTQDAAVLAIGRDRFTRSDLAAVACFNFVAAANLSAILNRELQVKDTRDVFDRIHPNRLALPQVWIPSNGHKNGAGGDRKSTAFHLAAKLDAARRASFQAPPTLPGVKVPKAKPGQSTADIKRRRQVSARILAQFDKDKPKPTTGVKGARGIGSLVRRGYLAKQGKGYIRTDKPYSLDAP